MVAGREIYYVRANHIGRPVFATNAAGTKVWEASYLPFGGVHTSGGTPINLRFPGQWYQAETGLHQNWMRDYDPTTGRYMQADPLGLVDGASIYGYARQSPMRYKDPRGEDATNLWNNQGGRNPVTNGATNGNWGGACWSGGQFSCGEAGIGRLPPTDSADACYMRHDYCYEKCGDTVACRRQCDAVLLDELRDLVEDPRDWAQPPTPGTEAATTGFMDLARRFFQ